MGYIYKVNKKIHCIFVKDDEIAGIYPEREFAHDLNEVISLVTPGIDIADFMSNAMLLDIDEYNKFHSMRAYLCDQIEMIVDLKKQGYGVVYPDYKYFNALFGKIKKKVMSRNLSGEKSNKMRGPFVNEFIDCVIFVLTANIKTAYENGCIEKGVYRDRLTQISDNTPVFRS